MPAILPYAGRASGHLAASAQAEPADEQFASGRR